ncbi:unnamed protein product [Auanema sp. JU1783]|nr:unnamed protein product [Auanema sp. JU1783]
MVNAVEEAVLQEWIYSSRLLFVSVVFVCFLTLPLLPFCLFSLRKHRKSQYYACLVAIIIGNFVLLSTICATVFIETFTTLAMILHGSLMCKLSGYIVDASSCFIHWTYVVMYIQRCVYVFCPMRSRRNRKYLHGYWSILCVLAFSLLTQIWTPLLITKLTVSSDESEGAYCGVDPGFNGATLQTIVVIESIATFFIPFILTVITDISVLILRNPCQTEFALIAAETITVDHKKQTPTYMKIVSQKNINDSEHRRTLAIRRCLLMATINLLLNLPNYSLRIIDEFIHLQSRGGHHARIFLWADAIAYILYLLQFPLLPLYIYFLRADLNRGSSSRYRQASQIISTT